MTGSVADPADPLLDPLPAAAVEVGRALRPVLETFGRAESLAELARQAGGFADDPPVVGVRAVAGSYGLRTAVLRCGADDWPRSRHRSSPSPADAPSGSGRARTARA